MTPVKALLRFANMDKCKINYPVKKSATAGPIRLSIRAEALVI